MAIQVENLSKAYQLGDFGTGALTRDIHRWWMLMRGHEDPYLKIGEANDRAVKGTSDIVWSLKDINFEIKEGDAVGIIGRNGAGKSTLLKLLSRVTAPTTGHIKVKGRIASLLEVGTGFHPELTGGENIYLNGAIMGMSKREIKRKFDEIVDFAGVDRYIDTPVKRYSSGMYVRLAFAVAAYLDAEILVVDEVLAVGDAEFQKKCLGKMSDVSKGQGRTVLFVSHNMNAIRSLCSSVLVLNNGSIASNSPTNEALSYYMDSYGKNKDVLEWSGQAGDENGTLLKTWVNSKDATGIFHTAEDIEVGIEFEVLKEIPGLILGISVWSSFGYPLVFLLYDDVLENTSPLKCKPGNYTKKFIIPKNTLATGDYTIEFFFGINRVKDIVNGLGVQNGVGSLRITLDNISGIGQQIGSTNIYGMSSLFRPNWKIHQ